MASQALDRIDAAPHDALYNAIQNLFQRRTKRGCTKMMPAFVGVHSTNPHLPSAALQSSMHTHANKTDSSPTHSSSTSGQQRRHTSLMESSSRADEKLHASATMGRR